jgi:ribokinase
MANDKRGVAILGVFVADVAFRAGRQPEIGETLIGSGFKLGPGGKGSNQSVAAARVGADVTFISKIGKDEFGAIALATWKKEGVKPRVIESADEPTGAAYIFVNDQTGDNAIIVVPGAGGSITPADVDAVADTIRSAAVFVTQLEQPVDAAKRGLEIARAAGVVTLFNPAPAVPVDDSIYPLCDYVTPNENEASLLSGVTVETVDDARKAGDVFLKKGVGAALITLGEAGALLHTASASILIPAFKAGPVVETTGAGDAFNGGFATAISRGATPAEAVRFGCAVAGISVTRAGTAPSMPRLAEVEALLAQNP